MGFGSDFGLSDLFSMGSDAGAVAAAPATGGMSLMMSPSVMGALGDLGSAAIGGGLSFLGQSSANSANQASAREQMAFQERMDSTKYQRAVKDLQAAGLNPMMAYGNMAAGSPSGSLGVGAQNTMSGVGNAIAGIKSSEITKRGAETANLHEQNQLINATTAKEAATAKNLEQQTRTNAVQELVNAEQLNVQRAQARASNASAARDIAQAKSIIDDNAKKAMMSNVYDVGEAVTGWAKDRVQKLNSAFSNVRFGKK
jgi:hypothetical protein